MFFKECKKYVNPTESIKISECKSVKTMDEETGKKFLFRLETHDRQFNLQAETHIDKESWIGSLGKAMIKPSVKSDEYDI